MSGHGPLNIVLVGRVGNGKSSTGNSILGARAFRSKACPASVTLAVQAKSAKLDDEQVINVIDTPGLFDTEYSQEYITKEIVKCMDLAKDGIHAVVLVYTVKSRFSKEEEAALHVMMDVFGVKVTDYMIVVLTGADQLEDDEEEEEQLTPETFIRAAPDGLKKILEVCRGRYVFFDNKTKDEAKKKAQKEKLIQLVNLVLNENRGLPFTNEFMIKMKESKEKSEVHYEDMLKLVTEKIENSVRASIQSLEQRLNEELNARISAEARIRELQGELDRARGHMVQMSQGRPNDGFMVQIPNPCSIM